MTETRWNLGASDGEVMLRTGVAGPAARMGHRLTIRMESWRVTVDWAAGTPVSAHLEVDVDSLQVVGGEGGLTPLSAPEKAVARANALKTLDVSKFPTITFGADDITAVDGGYRMRGPLRIHGVSRATEVDLAVHHDDAVWRLRGETVVEQSAFGMRPFSLMMGSLKVADAVTVSFTARHAQP